VVKADIPLNPSTFPKNEIGIDLGTANFLTTSDGRTVSNPKFLRCLEVKLARRQRELSRKKKGSKNRYRARVKVARVHSKITNSREDFLHKLSSRLIGENQAIYVEEIDTKALLERKTKLYNHRASKAIADSGWGSFLDMLEYKAKLYGRRFKRVCARYTSQICNICKYHIGKLQLYIRSFQCSNCNTLHNRDVNAAKNILTVGLTGIVCGEYVRPGSPGRLVEAETATLRSVAVSGV
jgi:putative transposase